MALNDLPVQPQKWRVMQGTRSLQDSILKTKYSWQGTKLLMCFYIWGGFHCTYGTLQLSVISLNSFTCQSLQFMFLFALAKNLGGGAETDWEGSTDRRDKTPHALVWGGRNVVLDIRNSLRIIEDPWGCSKTFLHWKQLSLVHH